jgi:hypothetical protein
VPSRGRCLGTARRVAAMHAWPHRPHPARRGGGATRSQIGGRRCGKPLGPLAIRRAPHFTPSPGPQGYPGGRSPVYRWLVEHHGVRRRRGAPTAGRPPDPPLRPRQWATWRLQRWTTLPRTATRRLRQRLEDPVVPPGWTLVHPLAVLVRHRQERAWAGCLRRAEASGIPELVRFAQGLQRDEAAVRAAHPGALEPRTYRRVQ